MGGKRRGVPGRSASTARDHLFPQGLTEADLLALVARLNADRTVHGILVQLPLPAGHRRGPGDRAPSTRRRTSTASTRRTSGRLLAGDAGRRSHARPAGILEILDHYGVDLKGAEAVVVGRSRIVGKPLAQLLLGRHATVTTCHTRTRDLAAHTRRAEILAVAAGRPGGGDRGHGPVRRGRRGRRREPAARTASSPGTWTSPAVGPRARAITPVPGGVGPMTIAMLMRNTLDAARRQAGARLSDGRPAAPARRPRPPGLHGLGADRTRSRTRSRVASAGCGSRARSRTSGRTPRGTSTSR